MTEAPNRLQRQADAMVRYAAGCEADALHYDAMAETFPHRADYYRVQAARCRLDAAWYSQKAAERQEWADAGPVSAEEMFAYLSDLMRKDAAA